MPAIVTLRDLREAKYDDDRAVESSSKNYRSHNKNALIAHIPGLFEDHHAKKLLDRIQAEFLPILQKRGYNVTSVSEMCCCGDGLDHLHPAKGKKKIVSSNILGYNQSMFRGGYKSHTVHLRLRQPANHDVFYDYEAIAATMSHELAHCEIGPHNAQFYKLMEQIQEQHAVFLAMGIVADQQGFPLASDQAYTLGGADRSQPKGPTLNGSNNAAGKAAMERQRQQATGGGGRRLGGSTGEFTKWLRPGEAAGMAAELRRLQDEVWCQPCEPEVIELSDDDGEQLEYDKADSKPSSVSAAPNGREDDNGNWQRALSASNNTKDTRKAPPVSSCAKLPTESIFVDLTCSDDDDDIVLKASSKYDPGNRPKRTDKRNLEISQLEEQDWECPTCTFQNAQIVLVCSMCGANKVSDKSSLLLARKLQRVETAETARCTKLQGESEHVKNQEVEQSIRDFGFNIYGSK